MFIDEFIFCSVHARMYTNLYTSKTERGARCVPNSYCIEQLWVNRFEELHNVVRMVSRIWRNTHSGTDGRASKQYAACMRATRESDSTSVHDRYLAITRQHDMSWQPQFPTTTHGSYWIKNGLKPELQEQTRQCTSLQIHLRILLNKNTLKPQYNQTNPNRKFQLPPLTPQYKIYI